VAIRRAAHQLLDVPPVFSDPLAVRIAAVDPAAILDDDSDAARLDRYRRAFIVARSRYVEDQLAGAVAQGVRQFVVLGAGLDTFGCRNPHADLQVFELDHPSTQAWKRERLAGAGIEIPASLVFVPVDFENDRLSATLAGAGFDSDRPAFFSWLGVVAYLEEAAVAATLRFVATCARGSCVVFDYAIPPASLDARQRARFDVLADRVAAIGEPWRTFFDPAAIGPYLRNIGFSGVDDLGPDDVNRRYFERRRDDLRVAGIGRMAHLAKACV
jgi:methyltransferase (TIGR00027 family)